MTKHGEKRVIAYLLIVSGSMLVIWSMLVKQSSLILLDLPAGLIFTVSGFWLWRRNARRRGRRMLPD